MRARRAELAASVTPEELLAAGAARARAAAAAKMKTASKAAGLI